MANKTNRIYRMNSSQPFVAIFWLIAALFFTVREIRYAKFVDLMFPIVITLGLTVFTVRTFRNAVCFSDNRIELRGLFGTRVLPLDKIIGRRRYLSPGNEYSADVWHFVFETNGDQYPKLDIKQVYRFDDYFYTWFNGLPDLDEIDYNRPPPWLAR